MGGVIQKSKLIYRDADLVDPAIGIWCPSVQGPGGLTLRDLSRRGNDGTLTNMTTADWVDRALSFDGANDYIDVGDVLTQDEFSFSVWAKFTSDDISSIVTSGYSYPDTGYLLRRQHTTDNVKFFLDGGVEDVVSTANGSATLNVWQHYAITYDGTTAAIYKDGELHESKAIGYVSAASSNGIGLAGGAGSYMLGQLDDVRIFPHALQPSQIKRLYKGGQGRGIGLRRSPVEYEPIRTLTYPNLRKGRVAAYSAGEQGPGGLTWRDQQGNNHGTLTNMPLSAWDLQALGFATNDYVLVSDSPFFGFGTGPFSISAWVNVTSPTNNDDGIISKDNYPGSGSTYKGWLLNVSGGTKWSFETRNVVSGSGPDTKAQSTSTATSGWTHLAGVRDGVSPAPLRLYVDGDLVDSTTEASSTDVSTTVGLTIGALNALSLSQHLDGYVDNVAIYNRALPHAEIKLLALRRGIAYEQTEFEPYVTQWGSVATAAEEAAGGFIGGGMGSFF